MREVRGVAGEVLGRGIGKLVEEGEIPRVTGEVFSTFAQTALSDDPMAVGPNLAGVALQAGIRHGLEEAEVDGEVANVVGQVYGRVLSKGLRKGITESVERAAQGSELGQEMMAAAQAGLNQMLGEETAPIKLDFMCDAMPSVEWEVGSGTYTEKLNDPFTLWLQLVSKNVDDEPLHLLGKSCRLTIRRGRAFRQITGVISEVQEGSTHPQRITTNIVVDPAFEVLRHRINTKIFQNKTVPEILTEVLDEGLRPFDRPFELRLTRTYPTCEYRVQYNESDLAFCERLMEEESIVYWFEFFDTAQEKIVLSDAPTNYGIVESFHDTFDSGTLLYNESEGGVGGHEFVSSFHVMSQLRPTKLATRHFDWTHPSMPYEATAESAAPGAEDPPNGAATTPVREVYQHDDRALTFHEYRGTAFAANDMDAQLGLRREAHAFDARVAEGSSSVTGMTTGHTFELFGHPQNDLEGRYLVLSVTHSFDGSGVNYQNQFQCIPTSVPFRPKRITPKPRLPSMQTATVVGPAGEEIHTDEHGRIKVQFHWDRLGAGDDHSSCWIRVMQPWAGSGWGFVFIPRIGMEVVVNFVNGDLDQPLVVGSVYNGENPPPYPLPDEKTKSTIKTNSSLGGGGFNELRFEDKAGSEEIYTHAQKDYNEVVEHDHNTIVHNCQTNTVDMDQTESVHQDQRMTVDRHRTKTIGGNEQTSVRGTRTEEVTGDETITLRSNRAVSITATDTLTVSASRTMTVMGALSETVIGAHAQSVIGAQSVTVGGIKAEEVRGVYTVSSSLSYGLTAGTSITLTTGKSSITMKKDGTITIQGEKINIKGKQLIEGKGGKGSLTLNQSQARLKGPKVEIKGKSLIKLKASKITEN